MDTVPSRTRRQPFLLWWDASFGFVGVILQADSQCGVLSANVARRVRGPCQQWRANDRIDSASQRGLGLRLGEGRRPQKRALDSNLVTGHILDAQMYFPEDVRISSRCAGRALTYLAQVFANCNDRQVFEEYCPIATRDWCCWSTVRAGLIHQAGANSKGDRR